MKNLKGSRYYWFLPILVLLGGCGIPKIKGELLSSRPGAQVPDLVAILPPDNESNDLSAVEVIQRAGGTMLTSKGYYAISNKAQDSILQQIGITDGGQLKAYRADKLCKTLGVQGLIYSTVEKFNEINIGFYMSKEVKYKMNLTDPNGDSLWEGEAQFRIRALQLNPQDAAKAFVQRKAGELLEKTLRVHLVPETEQASAALGQKIIPWPNPQEAQKR